MLKEKRQENILSLVENHDFLTIAQMTKELNVSEMTIRRDITEMDKKGQLIKLHGGAQKKLDEEKKHKILTTEEKYPTNIKQKVHIGKIINSLIKDDMTIFIGPGTTLLHALPEIQAKNIRVTTNSLLAFNYLKDHTDYRIILTGGEFHKVTDEFFGTIANRSLENINIDIAFGATNGIYGSNITSSRMSLGTIQMVAFSNSKVKCIVADSSKLGVSDIYTFNYLDKIDYLITDNKITEKQKLKYGKYVKILAEEVNKH